MWLRRKKLVCVGCVVEDHVYRQSDLKKTLTRVDW
ncbi:hypothetical protein LCGC14_0163260 [marine sediment metagenome]|uniref:Uncharacterized protein n=1 Tax=marine sediment metagenome TaxID=412755 RepID=A0A0F9VA83_9ZZZZ